MCQLSLLGPQLESMNQWNSAVTPHDHMIGSMAVVWQDTYSTRRVCVDMTTNNL